MDAFSKGVNAWLIGLRSWLGDRRASGSYRSTKPKMRTISPNSVPSMITAPMSEPLRCERSDP